MLAVLDTNVLVAALRSRLGASNALLRGLATGRFQAAISTPLCLEYDEVLKRTGLLPEPVLSQVDLFLDSFCSIAVEAPIYFHLRPFLPDPNDDLVLECAVAAGASHIVTYNLKDLKEAEALGVSVVTPAEFLVILGK